MVPCFVDRVVHLDGPDPVTVDHDLERATTDLYADRLMRQLDTRSDSPIVRERIFISRS